MFCPVGYRSAAELWGEFRKHRLEAIYESAVEAYNNQETEISLLRGSPLDICEHSFLKSLCAVGIHLASPDGKLVRVHIALEDGVASLFSVVGPYASAYEGALAFVESKNPHFEEVFKGPTYEAWPHDPSEKQSWVDEYQTLSIRKEKYSADESFGLKHHTLPMHFVRTSYTIADETPPWANGNEAQQTVAPIVANFGGWSVCMDQRSYENVWQDYLAGRKNLFASGRDVSPTGKPGRPRLDRAREAFEAMGSEKGELSWKQVASKIERETGEKPSHKSLRNWRDDAKKGK